MIRPTTTWILLALMGGATGEVMAQPLVKRNDRIRISLANGPTLIGSLVRRVPDTVEVFPEAAFTSRRFPVAQVRRVQISRGRSSAAAKGLILGAASGVAAGALIGILSPGGAGELTQGQVIVAAATGLGIIGMGGGLFIGAFFTVENWERAELPATLATRENPGVGTGLNVRIVF